MQEGWCNKLKLCRDKNISNGVSLKCLVLSTKNWKAFEDRQPGPSSKNSLFVTGKFETNNGPIKLVLTKANPQGTNDKILILDLILEYTGGSRTADISYTTVRYDEQVSEVQYTSI